MTTVSSYADAGWTLERKPSPQQIKPSTTQRPSPRTVASHCATSPVMVKPAMPARRLTAPSINEVRLAAVSAPISATTKPSSGGNKRRPVSRRRDLLDALRNFGREQMLPDDVHTGRRKSGAASSLAATTHAAGREQSSSDDKVLAGTETHRRSRSLFFNQKTLFGGGGGGGRSSEDKAPLRISAAETAAIARYNAMSAAVAASAAATRDIASEATTRSRESLQRPQARDEHTSSFAKFHLPDAATRNDSLTAPVRKEVARTLPPPRRQTRRARAQSGVETMRDDVTTGAAVLMRASASAGNGASPQKYDAVARSRADGSPRRLQRRTSESSLASSTAGMSASVRPRVMSYTSCKRLHHTDSIGTDISRGSSAAELRGEQGDRHSFCSSIESNSSCLSDVQQRVSPLEHPYHTRTSRASPSLASYASAQSDVWGSCYSSSSSSSSTASSPTWQITPLRAYESSHRRPSTASTVPPVPAVPVKYALQGGGVSAAAHISSIVAHVSSSRSMQTGRAPVLQKGNTPLKRCESEVSMAIANCVRQGAANTMAQYERDDCRLSLSSSPSSDDDDDEETGPISLETPTFGFVASFVTATSTTPRPSNQAYFSGARATTLPPRPNSAHSGWSSSWALGGDVDTCALDDDLKRGLLPFRMSECVPVSPKTVEAGWEKRTATIPQPAAQPMIRSFSTQGLGLSHVKMALAERTHALQHHSLPRASSAMVTSRFSQDSDSCEASRQTSISSEAKRSSSFSQQTLSTLIHQRRSSVRQSASRSRVGAGA